MTRTRKTTSLAGDGMAWLQVAPFPALNPWNWWALSTPMHSMSASLKGAQAMLQAWRVGSDSLRVMARAHQDAVLALWDRPAEPDEQSAPVDAETTTKTNSGAEAADFVAPMLDVTRAYGRVGKAFIAAQRDTMRAFAYPGKPH
jgi:hypothetical protein